MSFRSRCSTSTFQYESRFVIYFVSFYYCRFECVRDLFLSMQYKIYTLLICSPEGTRCCFSGRKPRCKIVSKCVNFL